MIGSKGLYATKTDIHEALAQAFDAAGRSDSAAYHYRWCLNAWRHADCAFQPRISAAAARLEALKPRS